MEYNKEQQEVLIQDFIDMLLCRETCHPIPCMPIKMTCRIFPGGWKDGITGISMTGASMNIFFICRMR